MECGFEIIDSTPVTLLRYFWTNLWERYGISLSFPGIIAILLQILLCHKITHEYVIKQRNKGNFQIIFT